MQWEEILLPLPQARIPWSTSSSSATPAGWNPVTTIDRNTSLACREIRKPSPFL
jgi:hypothetical protein